MPLKTDPVGDLQAIQERLNRLFEDTLQLTGGAEARFDEEGWSPPVDIYETDVEFVITAEIPGLSRESIHLDLGDGVIKIHGERAKSPSDGDETTYHRIERNYGVFERTFRLPAPVASDQVTARYQHGVLTVTLPKGTESKPIRVEVSE